MFLLGVLMATVATSFGAYNAAKPADNEYVADVPALVRENFRAIKDDAIVNAGTVSGLSVGNASGNIPRSNGTLNTNLNADLLDGYHASAFNASDALLLRLNGSRAMTGRLKFSGNYGIFNTADTGFVTFAGGNDVGTSHGGLIYVCGNLYSTQGGQLQYYAGDVSTGDHIFYTRNGQERFRIGYDGSALFSGKTYFNAKPASIDTNVYINQGFEVGHGDGTTYPIRFQLELDSSTTYFNNNLYYSGGWKCFDTNRAASGIRMYCANADSYISFWTNAANSAPPNERMRLTKYGHLLINTTIDDGSNKLQVNGNAKITGTIESTGAATVGGDLTVTGAGTNFRNAIKAVDGSGSGLEADKIPLASPSSPTNGQIWLQ